MVDSTQQQVLINYDHKMHPKKLRKIKNLVGSQNNVTLDCDPWNVLFYKIKALHVHTHTYIAYGIWVYNRCL